MPNSGELAMNPNDMQARLTRLQRECDVSAAPAILLGVACSVLVIMLALNAVTDETSPTQAREPIQPPLSCAGGNVAEPHPLGLAAPADVSQRPTPAAGPT